MIADPLRRGQVLGAFFLELEAALWSDIVESGLLPADREEPARREWECFALHGCVRGLVAAGGFGEDNARAIEALHEAVGRRRDAADDAHEPPATRRGRWALRYEEYGAIARTYEARGDEAVLERLGRVAARHVSGTDIAHAELGIMLAELHEAIAHGAAESVRTAGA